MALRSWQPGQVILLWIGAALIVTGIWAFVLPLDTVAIVSENPEVPFSPIRLEPIPAAIWGRRIGYGLIVVVPFTVLSLTWRWLGEVGSGGV